MGDTLKAAFGLEELQEQCFAQQIMRLMAAQKCHLRWQQGKAVDNVIDIPGLSHFSFSYRVKLVIPVATGMLGESLIYGTGKPKSTGG
jgi:hypothetical protein